MHLLLVHSLLFSFGLAQAAITAYGPHVQSPLGTTTAASASYTGAASYDQTILNAPAPPNPPPPTQFNVELQTGDNLSGLSIQQEGSFFGFSIEFSVTTQVLGLNSSFLQVPFLNLMANLRQRGGSVKVRVGGNTQETATLVSSTPDGAALEKDYGRSSNPTSTPPLVFTSEIIKMMAEISALTDVYWYMGVPFNDTQNWRLQIAEVGEAMLGKYLIGLQAGNEPDLYSRHGHRPNSYSPQDYKDEFGLLINAMNADSNIPNKNLLIGPNLAGVWSPPDIWQTGFATDFNQNLAALGVERYPTDNCYAQFGIGTERTGQEMFPSFLTHQAGISIVNEFPGAPAYAQSVGKPFIMSETNTASCGGFPGLSDSFGAALWGIDYALQLAYSNFSTVLFHVGGQSVYYNPFTPPVTNQSTFNQWTIGPIYYSALVVAEALGSSNTAQVLDLQANGGSDYTPGYAIYENGQPVRVALTNFITDPSGNSDYTANISIGGTVPAQVQVKYLLADSVSQIYNFTWAGQTFGGPFTSDGRLNGTLDVQTIPCDQINNVCQVEVPAPGFALVFLTDNALSESDQGPTMTFSTTTYTNLHGPTITVDPSVLATSNGEKGLADALAGTSQGRQMSNALGFAQALPSLVAVMAGALIVGRLALIR
ncbi:glycoside hydrolase family 79 protein [Suillus subaureus]|uniref:Glycoside hydrolase family 79 protein n=1 Tax=Suillus subaureus TaxID=48587 RepID=A0A9P7E0C6_9AGAM|nr:glycoside hydrolase family 79 protein [Suillus subaureus]KAG1807867.1 glycoside hydrolase family 79 protein [Suillus subaureus]